MTIIFNYRNVIDVMDLKTTILVPPAIKNITCAHPRYTGQLLSNIGATELLQAFFILVMTLAIVGSNLMVIIVINCRRYSSFIHPQVSFRLIVIRFIQQPQS